MQVWLENEDYTMEGTALISGGRLCQLPLCRDWDAANWPPFLYQTPIPSLCQLPQPGQLLRGSKRSQEQKHGYSLGSDTGRHTRRGRVHHGLTLQLPWVLPKASSLSEPLKSHPDSGFLERQSSVNRARPAVWV